MFSRCDVRHALIWGATNPLIFGKVESLIKTNIFRNASFPPPTKSPSSSQNIRNKNWNETNYVQLLSTSSQLPVLILGSFSSILDATMYELRRKLYFSWTRLVQERNELDWAFMQDILINHNGTSCLMVYLAAVTSGMSWYGDLINTSAPPPWSRIQEVLSV